MFKNIKNTLITFKEWLIPIPKSKEDWYAFKNSLASLFTQIIFNFVVVIMLRAGIKEDQSAAIFITIAVSVWNVLVFIYLLALYKAKIFFKSYTKITLLTGVIIILTTLQMWVLSIG